MHRVRGHKMEELNEPTTVESKSRLQKILTSDALTQYRIKKGSSSNTTESKEKDTNIIPISRKIKQELIDREIPNKRKRKDSTDSETNTDNNNKATENKEQADSVEEIDETFYTIIVSNFPESWIFEKICAYISQVLPGMPVIIESDDNNKHEVRINFKSSEQWLTGQDILRDKVVGGRKLHIESEGPMTDADSDTSQATDIIPSMEHLHNLSDKMLVSNNILVFCNKEGKTTTATTISRMNTHPPFVASAPIDDGDVTIRSNLT
ncbi:uncharacterized protein [Epargyreus clarus]|uniref:uncharacterized protein n=1 Tax=Epargyreus clarus TaxID=520877 RepID=UPI003C2B235B